MGIFSWGWVGAPKNYQPHIDIGDGFKDSLFSSLKIGEMIPNLTIIFFKGVETTI